MARREFYDSVIGVLFHLTRDGLWNFYEAQLNPAAI